MSLLQSTELKNTLWKNTARTARAEVIPTLSRILGITISANDFTGRAEFEDHMTRYRNIGLREERFKIASREEVQSRLRQIITLGSASKAFLFFGRSARIGGLLTPSTPSAETILSLLDWDKDDVFVFDASAEFIVHVDLSEDWLRPEDMGVSPRQMLYIISTPN